MLISSIQRTSHSENVSAGNMGVDHSGLERRMPQEFLNCPDIVALFQKMGGEAVPQARGLGDVLQIIRFFPASLCPAADCRVYGSLRYPKPLGQPCLAPPQVTRRPKTQEAPGSNRLPLLAPGRLRLECVADFTGIPRHESSSLRSLAYKNNVGRIDPITRGLRLPHQEKVIYADIIENYGLA
jgi:hypothetical protein